MKKDNFDQAWQRVRDITGWKKKGELSDFLDIKQQSVSGAIKRGSFPLDWAYRIAKAYNSSTDIIIDGNGHPCSKYTPQNDEFDYVPMAEAELSAGGGSLITSDAITENYAFKTDWLRKSLTSIKSAVLMTVIGNSMEPTIKEGDIVMLDTGRTHIHDSKIYALRMDDTIMIKRLSLRPGDKIQVISDNKTEYDSYIADKKEIIVIAQVVWFARALVKQE